MIKYFVCFWFFIVGACFSDAQVLDEENWKDLTKDYDYTETYKEREAEVPEAIEKKGVDVDYTGVAYFIIISVVILILGGLVFLVLINLKKRNVRVDREGESFFAQKLEDNIEDKDLDLLYKEAVVAKEFKLALRILFLGTLKILSKNEIIIWKKDKTNGEYLHEMIGKKQYPIFLNLTLAYERIWYSDLPLTEELFEKLEPTFLSLKSRLGLKNRSFLKK